MTETTTVTDEELEVRKPAQPIKIILSTHRFTFNGWHLASASTKRDWSTRWTTMDLYRIANPKTTAKYLLLINGRSVVYHTDGHDCSSGEFVDYAKLPTNAKPCPKCLRRVSLKPSDTVLLETDIPSVYECPDAVTVVTNLLSNSRNGGKQVASSPMMDLLYDASDLDTAFLPDNVEIQL